MNQPTPETPEAREAVAVALYALVCPDALVPLDEAEIAGDMRAIAAWHLSSLAAARAEEREACARVAETLTPPDTFGPTTLDGWDVGVYALARSNIAAALRARPHDGGGINPA